MDTFYPPSLRDSFTNRAAELRLLEHAAQKVQQGQPLHLSFLGPRRVGKTMLLKEFLAQHQQDPALIPAYVNFQTICTNPEDFAAAYMGWICFWFQQRGQGSVEPYLHLPDLLETVQGERVLQEPVLRLFRLLQQARIDRSAVLRTALGFPAQLAAATETCLLLFLDEFQEVTTLLRHKEADHLLGLFREQLTAPRTGYVIAGSLVSVMTELVSAAKSPLFEQFTAHRLGPFPRDEAWTLLHKLLGPQELPVRHAAYTFSAGHPYYLAQIAKRVEILHQVQELEITPELVRQAFLIETLSPQGAIHSHCDYLYHLSLEKARYYTGLKSILSLLAGEEGLGQNEIARHLKIAQGMVRNYLQALLQAQLLVEEEHGYYYADPVLRYWVAYREREVELSAFPRPEELADLLAQMDEKFQRAATELGTAKESEIREWIRRWGGQTFPGAWFGAAEDVAVPVFARIEPYESPDRQVQLDAVCEQGERWLVEVKWRGRLASEAELRRFDQACQTVPHDRRWFISRTGFTDPAREYAQEQGIWITDGMGLGALQDYL